MKFDGIDGEVTGSRTSRVPEFNSYYLSFDVGARVASCAGSVALSLGSFNPRLDVDSGQLETVDSLA